MQEKVSIIVVRYGQKFPSLRSWFGITRQSLVTPNCDPPDGNFCLYLSQPRKIIKITRYARNFVKNLQMDSFQYVTI